MVNKENYNKKVSIVVCAMNVADFVKDCLLSIKNNHPYEIIVVDGMSIDNTVKI